LFLDFLSSSIREEPDLCIDSLESTIDQDVARSEEEERDVDLCSVVSVSEFTVRTHEFKGREQSENCKERHD
jgi:hypothetical protein